MIKISKLSFLTNILAISLSACSGDKGPGEIGSKDDIVVINKGLPGAQTNMIPEGDFTATVLEQGQAIPAPSVEAPQIIEDSSKEPEQILELEQTQESTKKFQNTAPVMGDESVVEDVQPQLTQPVAEDQIDSEPSYPKLPSEESMQSPISESTTSTEPATEPVVPSQRPSAPESLQMSPKTPYPLDPDAPYSPKAMAAAAAAAGTPVVEPVVSPSGLNLADAGLIRSVQAALAAKAMYVGGQNGIMDADLLNAVTKYQADNKLPVTGGLNEETLKALGIFKVEKMDITPHIPKGRKIIHSYGVDGFKINGMIYKTGVIVLPDGCEAWQSPDNVQDISIHDFSFLVNLRDSVDVILLGTGKTSRPLSTDIKAALKENGLNVDTMDTGAACRTYNVLMAEDRRVIAILMPL